MEWQDKAERASEQVRAWAAKCHALEQQQRDAQERHAAALALLEATVRAWESKAESASDRLAEAERKLADFKSSTDAELADMEEKLNRALEGSKVFFFFFRGCFGVRCCAVLCRVSCCFVTVGCPVSVISVLCLRA